MPPKATKKKATKKAAKKEDTGIRIVMPEIKTIQVRIRNKPGSTMIHHQFSEKAIKQIEDKQQRQVKARRPKREPEKEFEASIYGWKDDEGKTHYGFPAPAFRKAMISAARWIDGLPMTLLRGAFFVVADNFDLELVEIFSPNGPAELPEEEWPPLTPEMRRDVVRLSGPGRPADLRYRGEFKEWEALLTLQIEVGTLEIEEAVNLVARAGFHVGVGEWRPEKDGDHGRFDVVDITPMDPED